LSVLAAAPVHAQDKPSAPEPAADAPLPPTAVAASPAAAPSPVTAPASQPERARRGPKTAPAATTPAAPEEMVGPVIMRNDSRDQVLDLYERWTGKILLRPAQLPEATFTLTLDKPLPKSEALRALETLFNLQGIGFAPLGERFIKVSQLQLTRTEAPEFIEGSTLGLPPSGRIASKLFTLQFLRVGEFVPQISQLINPNLGAAPVVFDKTNATLVIESVSNLQRIEELIEKLDRPSASGLAVKSYSIVNAKASDVANQLRTLLGGPLAATIGTATTYQPDDRTNSLILISDAREQALFDDLVAKLDATTSPNTRSEVVFLKHATATEVEALLARLVSGQSGGSGASSRSSGSTSRLSRSNSARTGATNGTTRTGANAPAPAAPTPNAAASAAVAGAASEEFSEHLTIVADERSNAIVIAGTPNDIKLIKSLVDRLDVLLAQVRIEVVIAEVTLQDDASSGISQMGLNVKDNKLTGIAATAAGGSLGSAYNDAVDSKPANTSGLADIIKISGGISLGTTPRKSFANILQTPSILTTHNKEAEIFVGETRPVISGTTSGSSGAATGLTSSSTVTQQEIGIRLRVLPLIGSSGDVQLEIEQEVEDVLGTVKIDNNEQPRIGRRTTTSYVSARNGDIIVLGGLQRASESKTTSRLGPIPWIGDLFGARSRTKGRTELIFFLRPTILTNTYLDNVEAMKRIDSTPQAKEVRAITDQRPAAAPYFEPAPAAKR
jgi:general secretion pathway protein D